MHFTAVDFLNKEADSIHKIRNNADAIFWLSKSMAYWHMNWMRHWRWDTTVLHKTTTYTVTSVRRRYFDVSAVALDDMLQTSSPTANTVISQRLLLIYTRIAGVNRCRFQLLNWQLQTLDRDVHDAPIITAFRLLFAYSSLHVFIECSWSIQLQSPLSSRYPRTTKLRSFNQD